MSLAILCILTRLDNPEQNKFSTSIKFHFANTKKLVEKLNICVSIFTTELPEVNVLLFHNRLRFSLIFVETRRGY
jgi:hypothetical protein